MQAIFFFFERTVVKIITFMSEDSVPVALGAD